MTVLGRTPAWSVAASLAWGVAARPSPTPAPGASTRSFAAYALSRGRGVPAPAREALGKVRELLEADRSRGLVVRIQTSRIGLEGETRVCAEYEREEDGARAFERADALLKGVDLASLAVEACAEDGAPEEERKKKEEGKP